jgi:hypothetical protein
MREWVKALSVRGLRPILNVLDTLSKEEARDAEQDAIAMVRATRGDHCLNSYYESPYH